MHLIKDWRTRPACSYLLVVGGDEPELQFHASAPLLRPNELQQVIMFHPTQGIDLILILPRLLVLRTQDVITCVTGRVKHFLITYATVPPTV